MAGWEENWILILLRRHWTHQVFFSNIFLCNKTMYSRFLVYPYHASLFQSVTLAFTLGSLQNMTKGNAHCNTILLKFTSWITQIRSIDSVNIKYFHKSHCNNLRNLFFCGNKLYIVVRGAKKYISVWMSLKVFSRQCCIIDSVAIIWKHFSKYQYVFVRLNKLNSKMWELAPNDTTVSFCKGMFFFFFQCMWSKMSHTAASETQSCALLTPSSVTLPVLCPEHRALFLLFAFLR